MKEWWAGLGRGMKTLVISGVLVVLLVIGALAGGGDTDEELATAGQDTGEAVQTQGEDNDASAGDASARLACGHWYNVRSDITDGVLTVPEMRQKLQEVHDDARVSEHPGIAEGARDMLAAVTADDPESFGDAAGRFNGACSSVDAL